MPLPLVVLHSMLGFSDFRNAIPSNLLRMIHPIPRLPLAHGVNLLYWRWSQHIATRHPTFFHPTRAKKSQPMMSQSTHTWLMLVPVVWQLLSSHSLRFFYWCVQRWRLTGTLVQGTFSRVSPVLSYQLLSPARNVPFWYLRVNSVLTIRSLLPYYLSKWLRKGPRRKCCYRQQEFVV
jgi:hypothetical protein